MERIKLTRDKVLPKGVKLMIVNGQATFVAINRRMGGRIVPLSEEEQIKLRKDFCIND